MTKPQKLEDPTRGVAYDAMCVWEWAMEAHAQNVQPFAFLLESQGYGTVREAMLDAIPYVREAWNRATAAGYEESFDYEFVPWFMANCVTFSEPEWVYDLNRLPPGFETATLLGDTEDGFVIFCNMLGGDEPVGTVTEEGEPAQWELFATEREAQLSIVDDLEEHIRQFVTGDRAYDEIPTGLYVVAVTRHPDGSLSTEGGEFGPPEQH
jgi:hypothetical protein